ncbi:MAG: Ku protein [Pseudomonadota bacterium]
MAARATSSGTISFGLVSIPVKFYTAAASEQASFNMLHKKCGGRVKQQYLRPYISARLCSGRLGREGFPPAR